ncbi:hypothetical protein GOP47_0002314 [Adiantum capillus-veneris]|uniref:Uncharacterized protein n=1 Tax=Adiantum capillus-veneris TaxID=13818 RepID=A0A9D4ZQV6_ADICA|nr:hypothetical protein GOP47_0002314 [Adiantum capillus-veneris]
MVKLWLASCCPSSSRTLGMRELEASTCGEREISSNPLSRCLFHWQAIGSLRSFLPWLSIDLLIKSGDCSSHSFRPLSSSSIKVLRFAPNSLKRWTTILGLSLAKE